MIKQPLPPFMKRVIPRITQFLYYRHMDLQINHVLVNEYGPGQGIMAHTDGPSYRPIVCTITTGSGQILNILDRETRDIKYKMYLEPRKALKTYFRTMVY